MNSTKNTQHFQFFQVGLVTCDLAGSVRLYADAFGFANGGSQAGWGRVRELQELDPDGHCVAWWLVSAQLRTQLEIFSYSSPPSRPLADTWSPADLGWVRIGIAITKFDRVLDKLIRLKIGLLTEVTGGPGSRRVAIRDPFAGVVIEIIEDGHHVAGYPRERHHGLDPVVLYVTNSVSTLDDARHYYETVVGLPILPLETLHEPEHETLWGLDGAQREGFVVQAGDAYLEVLQYEDPRGHRKRPDHALSDQGIMNIGLLARETALVQAVVDRLDADGRPPRHFIVGEGFLATYVNDQGRETELVAAPEAADAAIGLLPAAPLWGSVDDDAGVFRIVRRDRQKENSSELPSDINISHNAGVPK